MLTCKTLLFETRLIEEAIAKPKEMKRVKYRPLMLLLQMLIFES